MNKSEIFEELKKLITEALPYIEPEHIRLGDSLKDLGANSIDRMDIIVGIMEALEVRIPLVEFGKLNNIEGIVDLLVAKSA